MDMAETRPVNDDPAVPKNVGGKALSGVRVLDMTHVQSGPSATQLLAWLGADVIKLEAPKTGDITRNQLRDVPGVDSLYFTMLNCNKRSITVNMKSDAGKQIFTDLVSRVDILVENFGPGVVDRFGFPWERLQEINPRLIYASIKGFGPGKYANFKAYEVIAQAMGGSMATTGFEHAPPTVTGAQIGDSGTGIHLVAGVLAALYQRVSTGRGQRVEVAMQEAVLNLCRVKLRDQQRLTHGPLAEYPNDNFTDEVPRAGNASGGGQPGWAVRTKGGGPNDYIYIIVQPQVWAPLAELIGHPELADHPDWARPENRLNKLDKMFALIEDWSERLSKWEALEALNALNVPCGPVLGTKELIEDETLAELGAVVEVEHPQRGSFKTVGSPLRLSDSPVEIVRSPLLGEHTDAICAELGYTPEQLELFRVSGAI
ncbi:formyl-CoA transferase [Mycolicibacterium smegmatis]|nr:formyl-CoA transferase [Mycolicibacterium smegmatis]ABK70125.1 formyl-coenzyme A transferase [Mycolicibacterium smegmatis MC2 155]MCC3335402.1 formyl-CoA transferase [Mycolicibacterium smegmatis]MCO4197632.1 formyl-CoA transferase [Mycolicibacterium smegmatis]MDF1902163.1 formyl-CoA transferase [Mycolicibacterium smegmatis]MDF1909294.1 formyl-CoA transferase [Mycolicibacterium smegmatis]